MERYGPSYPTSSMLVLTIYFVGGRNPLETAYPDTVCRINDISTDTYEGRKGVVLSLFSTQFRNYLAA